MADQCVYDQTVTRQDRGGLDGEQRTLLYDSAIIMAVGTLLCSVAQDIISPRQGEDSEIGLSLLSRFAEQHRPRPPHDLCHLALSSPLPSLLSIHLALTAGLPNMFIRHTRIFHPRDESNARVQPMDLKVVLERHGKAVQGTKGLAGAEEMGVG